MIRDKKSKRAVIDFGVSLLLILILCGFGILRVNKYNNTLHHESFSGDTLFSEDYEADDRKEHRRFLKIRVEFDFVYEDELFRILHELDELPCHPCYEER